ncbi:ATP-binding protein [Arachnia propionica]|uniref:ATP-binding protein n=1 Tax=Arachnia propionica TaxID=1750 RepID=A0A3P1T5F2_9ACTN|nr:ATP-binding protein [Arachnia propionica]RRD04737.1 ATP-binding protein [Arachnia propionica]
MLLLRFTVRNHQSIRDEVTLDLTLPSLRTLRPRDDDWGSVIYPVAGIFGGNATGKTALLDALWYTFTAIRHSSTTWQAGRTMHRAPFLLDGTARTSTSSYELDFIHRGRRHRYGFEVDHDGIRREWLSDVPNSRWRTLLTRDRDERVLKFHPSLGRPFPVTDRELLLSRALLLTDSPFHAVAKDLVEHWDQVSVKDSHRAARLRMLADMLVAKMVSFADIEALLQVADTGVVRAGVQETEMPEHIRRLFQKVRTVLNEEDEVEALDDDQLDQVSRHLVFQHRGSAQESPTFSIDDESNGTIAWLSLAVPVLQRLREGGLLVVDEIDASLHPHLVDLLLSAFADPEVNTKQAQIIFTSHESYVLSPLSEVELEPEQVWFTDKSHDGVTELTCLAEFPRHPDANVAKRYLVGRYGGTPRLAPSMLAALVASREGVA